MKLSPLFIFLLLVIVLVISVIFCRYCMNTSIFEREGFVTYEANLLPTQSVVVPQYGPSPVIKMFDNLFFDQSNGNVIEVDSTQFMGNVDASGNYISGNVDTTGKSIRNLYISTRDGTEHDYAFTNANSNTTQESTIMNPSCSYNKWSYNTKCQTTGKYQMFYIPWNTDTYVHIVQTETPANTNQQSVAKPVNVYTYQFSSGSSSPVNAARHLGSELPTASPAQPTTDASDNQFVIDPLYNKDRSVYQLCKNIKFDASNGNLIVDNDKSITVYDRSKNIIPNTNLANTLPSGKSYNSWIVNDAPKTTQVVYVANGTNTVVTLIQMESSKKYKIANMARFDVNGLAGSSCDNNRPAPAPAPAPDSTPPPPPTDMSGNSDYYKWYWYWNSPSTQGKSEDYILKTQVVPPVCPSCPNCPSSSGTCTNCGGNGGSGTKNDTGSSIAGGKGIINNTVDAAGNVIGETVDAAGNVIGTTAKVAGGVVNTTVDTAGKVITGTVGAAENIVQSLLTPPPTGPGYPGPATTGYGSTAPTGYGAPTAPAGYGAPTAPAGYGNPAATGADYSYYGALPPKGSNYMPITADFSAFKK
jgi:hypothetical protein